jgi:hypothetical protein
MKEKLRTLNDIRAESPLLRLDLERVKPGCTAGVPCSGQRATLDEILAENEALHAVKATVAAPAPAQAAAPVKLTLTQRVLQAKAAHPSAPLD